MREGWQSFPDLRDGLEDGWYVRPGHPRAGRAQALGRTVIGERSYMFDEWAANVLVNLGDGGKVTLAGALLGPGIASGGTVDRSLMVGAPPCFFRHGLGLHKGMAREDTGYRGGGMAWWANQFDLHRHYI